MNDTPPAAPSTPSTCRYEPDVTTEPADNTVAATVDEPTPDTSTGDTTSTPAYADTDTAIVAGDDNPNTYEAGSDTVTAFVNTDTRTPVPARAATNDQPAGAVTEPLPPLTTAATSTSPDTVDGFTTVVDDTDAPAEEAVVVARTDTGDTYVPTRDINRSVTSRWYTTDARGVATLGAYVAI